jgi:hypothetical protein
MLAKFMTCLLGSCLSFSMLHAQAIPTATRALQIQAGGEVSLSTLDYGDGYEKGFSLYADADLTRFLGAEFTFHDANIITPHDIGEDSYLIGPTVHINRGRFRPYGKVLFGIANLKFAEGYYASASSQSYGVFALGGGLDIHIKRHINIRAIDFEYQDWPGFPPHGLTPYAYSAGAAYVF